MRHTTRIPEALGDHFAVRDAVAAGVGRRRSAAADLARPFNGIRSLRPPETPDERLQSLVPRLGSDQLIAGRTALHAWGYPYPGFWRVGDDVEVVVPTGAVRPRHAGVKGKRLAKKRLRAWWIGRIPIVDPLVALFMCAAHLTRTQLVVLIDSLITTADNYPDLHPDRPVFTVADIEHRLRTWGRFPGCARMRDALADVRERVESPKETETRLLITAARLPEPEVQFEVRADGRLVARVDLAYPELKIAVEYEGDGHRSSPEQWRRDIRRQRELEDHGWIVIRVTELDLRDRGAALLSRLRKAIATR